MGTSSVWSRLNDLLEKRSGGHCESCGFPVLMGAAERHHRKLRSQGGQDVIENLLLLCPHCHKTLIHGNPGRAYRLGFLVHSWEDPAEAPVRLASVGMAQLTAKGWYTLWFPPGEVTE